MKLDRNTIAFLTVLIVIGASMLIMTSTSEAPDETTTETGDTANTVLFEDINAGDITAIEISVPQTADAATPEAEATEAADDAAASDDAPVARYTRESADADWVLDAEGSTVTAERPLQQAAITTAAETLAGLVAVDSFTADELSQYGLDNPAATLLFETGTTSHTIRIGINTPQGTRYYALIDDSSDTVSIVRDASALDDVIALITPPEQPIPTPTPEPQLNIPGRIFPTLNAADIVRLTVLPPDGEEIIYVREGDDAGANWTVEGDDSDRLLDSTAMSIVASGFATLRATSGTETTNLDNLGLGAPLVITATDSNGTTYRLQVGDRDPSGALYYTLVDDFETVALVPTETLANLIDIVQTPPYAPEATAEATPEATAEATPDNS